MVIFYSRKVFAAILWLSLLGQPILGSARPFGDNDGKGTPESGPLSEIKLTGYVRDVGGNPIPGATVKVSGSTLGTITDVDGFFSLSVKGNDMLEVSFIGYDTQIFKVGVNPVSIVLAENIQQVNEVVVVGYGVQKKASVVGAISTVGTEELKQSASSNLGNALAGRLSGLTTIQTTGLPGNDDPDFYIRGRATWVNSDPLFIVDGIERSTISDIDANEIETISILKDASATAVYGVKGANGVILVTTRRGLNQRPEVSLSMKYGFQMPTRIPQFLRSYETALLKDEAILNDYASDIFNEDGSVKMDLDNIETILRQNGGFDHNDIEAFKSGTADPYYYPDIDWWDVMVRKATPQQQYNVNVKGGTRSARFFVSAGYMEQQGIFKVENQDVNFGYKRLNLRSNLDLDVTRDITFSINLAARVEVQRRPNGETWNSDGDAFYQINRIAPYETAIINPDGRPGYGVSKLNPWAGMNKTGSKRDQNDVLETNLVFRYNLDRLVSGLSLKAQLSYDSYYKDTKAYKEQVMWSNITSLPGQPYSYIYEGADLPYTYLSSSTGAGEKTYLDVSAYYDRTIGDHNLTALVLYNQSDSRSGSAIPYRYQGLVGRVTYNYAKRYFGEFNMGYNGSENFAKDKRFGFFPSYSLGWLASEESFLKNKIKDLTMLKIRGSYGLVGNDKIGGSRFLYIQDFNSKTGKSPNAGARFGTDATSRTFIYESMAANSVVTWEKALKSNLGFELIYKDGLFGLTGDVFYEHRTDILMTRQRVAAYFGADAPPANVGETQNKGFELDLSHRKKVSNDLSYWAKANVSYARNKILSKDEPLNMTVWQKEEGQSIGQYQGYIVEGFFESWEDIRNSPTQVGAAPHPGDLKYRDLNKDQVVNEYDVTYIGHTNVPELVFGFSLGFEYQGFDASAMFQGAAISNLYITDDLFFEFTQGAGKLMNHHRGRWAYYTDPFTGEVVDTRATATYPRLNNGVNPNRKESPNSFFLLDNSYLKLRNVEIGYSFNNHLTRRVGISRLRVYATGNNLFCLTKVEQLDPEGGGSQTYPQMKIYSFGVNVTF